MNVAVCICTCNRTKLLERLLKSLHAIDLGGQDPRDVAIIVVDNHPTGKAQAVCEAASASLPVALHFATETQRGISFARNRAVSEALNHGADFLAFIDDDDLPQPDWLGHLLERQRQTSADIVAGLWHPLDASTLPPWLAELPAFVPPDPEMYSRKLGIHPWIATCNVLIKRSGIDLVADGNDEPVFSPSFAFSGGEDTDFFIRAAKRGAKFAVAENSIIYRHFDPSRKTFRGVMRLALRYGTTTARLHQIHQAEFDLRELRRKTRKKLIRRVARLPMCVTSRGALLKQLYHVADLVGRLRGFGSGRSMFYHKASR